MNSLWSRATYHEVAEGILVRAFEPREPEAEQVCGRDHESRRSEDGDQGDEVRVREPEPEYEPGDGRMQQLARDL